jgi:hypothetical protein
MQNKINLIIEKCGGDSFSLIIQKLTLIEKDFMAAPIPTRARGVCFYNMRRTDSFSWNFITEGEEAKLRDQTSETVDALFRILGSEK